MSSTRLVIAASRRLTLVTHVVNKGGWSRCLSSRRRAASSFEDPQEEAQGRIQSENSQLDGVEAVQALPASVHRNNQLTAAGLLAFVGYIFYYSMTSVGGSQKATEDPITRLQDEAEQARRKREKSMESQDLANLDVGVSEKDLGDDVTLAVAAPDDIATMEEHQNKSALAAAGSSNGQRSIWNRIIFFWK